MNVNTGNKQAPASSSTPAEATPAFDKSDNKSHRKGLIISSAIALSVAVIVLVALFVPGGILSRMDPFVGQWQLVDIDDGTEELNHDVDVLNGMGVAMVLDVRADGTATLGIEGDPDSVEEPIDMKWEKAGEKTVVFTTADDETSATVDGNSLVMFQNEEGAMLFEKRI